MVDDDLDYTPETLYDLARRGKEEPIKKLLEKGIKADAYLGYDGSSALIMASKGGHDKVCTLLLNNNADPLSKTDELSGVLHHGIKHVNVIKAVLEWAVTAEASQTPDASKHSELRGLVNSLVNAQNEDSFTALHLAVYYGNLDVVKTLIELGKADTTIQSEDGTVFDILNHGIDEGTFAGTEEQRGKLKEYFASVGSGGDKTGASNGAPKPKTEKLTEKFGYDCFDGEV